MTTPVVYGGLGIRGNGLGLIGLGGAQPAQSLALSALPTKASRYIAHLYDHNLAFKATLGTVLNRPMLKLTQNAGYHPITLKIRRPVAGLVLGDVIRLTEQGDPTGTIAFSGNIETLPEELGPHGTFHYLQVTPWVAELGDGFFSQNYAVATDVAQFVRDAVATTAHCSVSPVSCPNAGITAIYNFQNASPLDAIHVARQIAGSNWWWFVDEQGVVWFQPVYTDANHPPTITIKRGADYNIKKPSSTIVGMRNKIPLVGGANPGDPGKISSQYPPVGTEPTASQLQYGVRAHPTLSFPTVTDQATLDAIAASLGVQYDRVLNLVELNLPKLGIRLSPGRPGGLTVRTWDPAIEALPESGQAAPTGYGPTLILQDVERATPGQKIVVGDVPFADIDTAYEAARVAQRTAIIAATAIPTPALTPQPAPPTTTIYGRVNATPGIKPMGGGIVTIATATFTTPKTGTCQVTGAVDARMEAWDNYIATPRRAVHATLSGGIFTGAWQELPFGLTRAIYDLSSAAGLVLAAGTYTVTIDIDTQEYNQMHIYSGWVQVAVIA